jgi:two-component system response regulator QseB
MSRLAPSEVAVLDVLRSAQPRVVSRRELVRQAGLRECSPRRVDAIVARLRRRIGPNSIRTVRGRGWALVVDDAGA